ncbi:hypothetical protein ES703_51743 [subsurface metagenome]
MSSNPLEAVIVPEGMVRDFKNTQADLAAGYIFNCVSSGNCMGLDLFIRNRGAAALTVSTDGQGAITIDPGDVYTINNVKFYLVTIVSAGLYDLQIFGIKISTLKKRGLM